MTIQSNLYVEKVISEHPIAVWMLNEQLDFISLLTETNRQFYNAAQWTITGATGSLESSPPGTVPFSSSVTTKLTGSGSVAQIAAINVPDLPSASLSTNLKNFAISGNLYIGSAYGTSYSYGYQYLNTVDGLTYTVQETKTIYTTDLNTWVSFSGNFDLPTNSTNIKMILKINVTTGGGDGNYNFYVNGFNLSQWSENFNASSLGISVSSINSSINLPSSLKTVTAACYGSTSKLGYYLSGASDMYAKNFGIPLVFGSSNVTKLYPNVISSVNYPSLIFPGYGFLNEKGRHNEYTAEMWISLNTDAQVPRKIFGSIGSTDGLYVEGGFLTFVFNKQFKSHYVGEWLRPMLIHIRYVRDNISVLVNGEEVINISFVESSVSLPIEYVSSKSQDWLGFYAYDDTQQFSIDSFAIYSYPVPNEVAKRRFVWGQGVSAPELENSSLNATTAFADYAYANSSVNYHYPDFANWKQGYSSNVIPNSNTLELPNYKLPTFNLGSKTIQNWYDDMQTAQSALSTKYFTFRPGPSSWNSQNCYIKFDNFAILNNQTESFYGIFETNGSASGETLFKITNKFSSDYLRVLINGTTLIYVATISGTTYVLSTKTITANQKFAAGINISNFGLQQIAAIDSFFSNQNNISINIAGTGSDTFTGKIYSFGFDNAYNNKKITSYYDSAGIFSETLSSANALYSHRSNYDLMPFQKYGIFFADISVSGYWEDYVPLSYFAKYVKDYDGNLNYDLDTIQFNVDYPEPIETQLKQVNTAWTYQDLFNEYHDPYPLTYENLANNFFTGWDSYLDMYNHAIKYYYYDTSVSNVRSYVSFQKIIDGINKNLVDFTNTDLPRAKGVVNPDDAATAWEDTVFELVDGSIILPPTKYSDNSDVDFNDLGIVSHVDFFVNGIINNPIKLRDLQLASQVLERTKFTELGSKYGVPTYPYYKVGLYYNFKGENPISLYKDSTPHLFLTRHSGWRMRGNFSPYLDRGVAMVVNKEQNIDLKISSLQVWLRYAENIFPSQEVKIMSIAYKTDIVDIYVLSESTGLRGKLYAKLRSTDAILTNVQFYMDGISVDTPYLNMGEWSCIGIAFQELLDFSSYTGRISLDGPLTYNNISYSVATNLEQQQSVEYRSWSKTLSTATGLGGWDYWQNSYTWQQVDIISSTNIYSIDPSDIYARYVGTNKIVVDDNNDGILINPEQFKVYSDVVWSTTVATPV
jgi:hypothetical protein